MGGKKNPQHIIDGNEAYCIYHFQSSCWSQKCDFLMMDNSFAKCCCSGIYPSSISTTLQELNIKCFSVLCWFSFCNSILCFHLQSENERNYHIFYQLCASAMQPEFQHLKLGRSQENNLLFTFAMQYFGEWNFKSYDVKCFIA